MIPKDVYILIPETCEYIVFHGKREFVDMIKDLEMGDHPGSSKWTQHNHKESL